MVVSLTAKQFVATWLLLSGVAASAVAAESQNTQQVYEMEKMTATQAYQEGKLLRAQLKNIKARPFLKYAADKGDAQAAYLYAMELSNYNTTIRTPPKAQEYLLKAAREGNRQAMQHLYLKGDWLRIRERKYWQNHYHDALVTLGQTDPAQALYGLAQYYEKSAPELSEYYLKKSMTFDVPRALMQKAAELEQGAGTYLLPGGRDKAVSKLYEQAADTGYMPAIRNYIQRLEDEGNYQEAFKWRERAVKEGDLTSLAAVAIILSGYSSNYSFIQEDLAKAKAYYDVYLETAGTDRLDVLYQNVERHYSDIMKTISPKDVEKSKAIEVKLKKQQAFYNHDLYWDI